MGCGRATQRVPRVLHVSREGKTTMRSQSYGEDDRRSLDRVGTAERSEVVPLRPSGCGPQRGSPHDSDRLPGAVHGMGPLAAHRGPRLRTRPFLFDTPACPPR